MKTPVMNPIPNALRRLPTWLVPCIVLLCAWLVPGRGLAQSSPNAPDRLTYQGFLVDASGNALATNAPRNYDIIFRIYDDPNAGTLLWGEQQTVTVDKGNFSVILGEGIDNGSDPRPVLSSIFRGPTASDRYIAMTVKGIGVAGGNADIMPRLRFLTSPYSFLAQQATKIVKADGTDLLFANSSAMTLDGSLGVSGANSLELGAGIAGKDKNAGKISYGGFTANTLDIVGAGTAGTNRQVKVWSEGGTIFTGPVTAPQFNGSGAGLTGVVKTQTGGHIYLGENGLPGTSGYGPAAVFTGAPGGENTDPLWISRFNVGVNSSELRVSIGDDPGSEGDKLVIGTMQGNGGNFTQGGTWSALFGFTSAGRVGIGTTQPVTPLHIVSTDPRVSMTQAGSNGYMQVGRAGAWDNGFAFVGLNNHRLSTDFHFASYDGDSNWDFVSDRNLKKDIVDAEPMLERALKVQVRRFRWKDAEDDSKHMLGVVAQELQPLFPDMVTEREHPETQEKHLTVGYGDFGVIAIKAIQELKASHDEELKSLRAELAEVKAQLKEVLAAAKQIHGNGDGPGKSAPAGR